MQFKTSKIVVLLGILLPSFLAFASVAQASYSDPNMDFQPSQPCIAGSCQVNLRYHPETNAGYDPAATYRVEIDFEHQAGIYNGPFVARATLACRGDTPSSCAYTTPAYQQAGDHGIDWRVTAPDGSSYLAGDGVEVMDPRDHPGTIRMLSRSRLAEPVRIVFLTDKPLNQISWTASKTVRGRTRATYGSITRQRQRHLSSGKYRVEGVLNRAPVGRLLIAVRSTLPHGVGGRAATHEDYHLFRVTVTCDKQIPRHKRGSCRQ